MKKIYFFPLLLSLIIFFSPIVDADLILDKVHYLAVGSVDEIESLRLDLKYKIDNVNYLVINNCYDGQGFSFMGTWGISFLNKGTNSAKLGLTLATELNDLKVYKAIGLMGEGIYLAQNRFYWNIKYFFDDEERVIYDGGIALPVTADSYLTLGLGNSFWTNKSPSFNIGIEVNI